MWSTRATVAVIGLTLLVAAAPGRAADCRHLPGPDSLRAAGNDNRIAGGTVHDGVVTLRLVMRDARWYPDGPGGCALGIRAFAEEGQSARIPGPLIRVRTGTEVRVYVRNALTGAVWVRGLQARDAGVLDSTEVVPGVTREFRFRAGAPGAWYYWAGGAKARVPASNTDGQLVGALVVDPAAADVARPTGDRVFVMTRWTPDGTPGNRGYQLNAINGRSWPHTERLTYTVADSVRWLVINASDALHMMHLHGFYFRVEARGDAAHDSTLTRAHPTTGVTTVTRPGEWISIAWSPDRSGNWLFHCHLVVHMSGDQRLDRMPGAHAADVTAANVSHDHGAPSAGPANHMTESMGGLLLGVTVRPARTTGAARTSNPVAPPARVVHIFANARPRVFADLPGTGFVIQTGARPPAPDSLAVPGTPLLLTRGQPVRITVHNRLPTPLTVHWHGIELESYADGVGGWSGMGHHIAPMIAPAETFVAAFTPPRAGTFMYHVHNEHGDELASGLYAPLLVLEPGQPFNPLTDRVFVIATGGPGAGRAEDAPAFINGTAAPDTLALVIGTTYRLRLIDIAANEAHTITLRGPAGPATWRALARDGWDLPSDQATVEPAQVNTASGVTRDFEFIPTAAGDYALVVATIVANKLTGHLATVPIRVRAP